jgi:tRNA threonylcarbamoyladenosine biosynthesis protein TsaE
MPILDVNSLDYISRSVEQTRRAGMRLGGLLRPGDTICLNGELGSGKTTLVQGIATGWGSLDPVSSPTFILVNVYRRPHNQTLYHLDAYRISNPAEAEDLDLSYILDNSPLVIEWADRIQEALPKENLTVTLRYIDEHQRDLVYTAYGDRYHDMLNHFRRLVYGRQ